MFDIEDFRILWYDKGRISRCFVLFPSGGAGLLEEENGWCWYVMCMDCGAHTAHMEFKSGDERGEAARLAAALWNHGKVVRGDLGE